MLNWLSYDKPLLVNGTQYENASAAQAALAGYEGDVEIRINFKQVVTAPTPAPSVESAQDSKTYRIEVRQYMTKKASPDFDFMAKFNNNNPMPLRVMYGEVLQETRGMYKMRLHGRAERKGSEGNCMKCGRKITHPVSLFYGLGMECGGHFHDAPPSVLEQIADAEKLHAMFDAKLRTTVWEGWVIKSAITDMQEI